MSRIRAIKQGVGVFAASAFNPIERVKFKDDTGICLPEYAFKMNIQLLKASDLNKKLRERGCMKVTVQRVCLIARGEKEVKTILDEIWKNPNKDEEIIIRYQEKIKSYTNLRKF